MRYLESWDDIKNKVDTLSTLVSIHHRQSTPTENYEDCFMRLKDDNFHLRFERPNYGYVKATMYKLIDDDNVEEQFNKYLSELKSIQYRLTKRMFKCHFTIELNGKSQADLDPNTHKTDDFKFKGLGAKTSGYDWEGYYYDKLPKGKVFVKINFYIV